MKASLAKAESSTKHWEREIEDSATCVIQVDKERDEAKQEAKEAQLVATSTGDAKARAEVDLTKALNSLETAEESWRRSEAETTSLVVELGRVEAEQASLLLELEMSKGEVSSLHALADKDREDMVKDY